MTMERERAVNKGALDELCEYLQTSSIYGVWDSWGDYGASKCEHEWVGSGMPGGMVFCKLCDANYDETLHGSSGL